MLDSQSSRNLQTTSPQAWNQQKVALARTTHDNLLTACIATVALAFLTTSAAIAQESKRVAAVDKLVDKVVQLTPNETVASLTLRPRQMAAGERMKLAPLEVLTAAGLEHVGVDPLQIERADLLVGFPGPAGPQGGLVVQLAQPFDIKNLNAQLLDGQGLQREGNLEFLSDPSGELMIHQLDPQTVVIGTKIFVKQMLAKRSQPGQIASLLRQVKTEQDALAIVSISTLQPLILGMLDQPLRELPGPVQQQVSADVTTIIESTNFAAIGLNVAKEERLQLVISGGDKQRTDTIEQSVTRLLEFLRESIVPEIKQQFDDPSQTSAATRSYIDRVSGVLTTKLTPIRRGDALVLDVDQFQSVSVIGTLTGLLLPAVQAARESARRMQSSNNLKQIGLAFHNFESAYSALPAAGGVDDNGKPLLSWRVAILPFIEQQALYEKFKMDEPWDSEHNIQLLEQMPDVYRHPNRNTQPGYTVYQAVVSDKSLLRLSEPSTFRDITDGTSNTILAVETNEAIAVPWTAPQDFSVDEQNPGKNLFTNGITQVVFGDGSVHTIAEVVADEILNALFTRAGGEVVQLP